VCVYVRVLSLTGPSRHRRPASVRRKLVFCMCLRERERERECVCVCTRARTCVCVCVCVCVCTIGYLNGFRYPISEYPICPPLSHLPLQVEGRVKRDLLVSKETYSLIFHYIQATPPPTHTWVHTNIHAGFSHNFFVGSFFSCSRSCHVSRVRLIKSTLCPL